MAAETLASVLDHSTRSWFETQAPGAWDWDVQIVESAVHGPRGAGAKVYLAADDTMIADYDAAVDPAWQMDGDNGITWETFCAPTSGTWLEAHGERAEAIRAAQDSA